MSTNTTAPATEYGYTLASGAGSDTRHIVAMTGTYYGAYAAAGICGTSPRIRFSSTRWFTTDDAGYTTPAAAAAAANPATLCKRCSARAAAVQVEDAPAPAADTTEDAAYLRRVFGMSFPALNGDVVTQGHADYCTENGHATHTNDGVVSPWCPRCGANTPAAPLQVEDAPAAAPANYAVVRAEDVQENTPVTGYTGSNPVVMVQAVKPAAAGKVVVTWITEDGGTFDDTMAAGHPIYTVCPEDAAPATLTLTKTPAADIHPRAVELAAMVTPDAARVDLDAATAPAATYRTARAVVAAYFHGGRGRGECVDAVILNVTGGDSHPARMFAASDAVTALQARVSGPITAGEYQTIVDGDRTVFVYGTWNN